MLGPTELLLLDFEKTRPYVFNGGKIYPVLSERLDHEGLSDSTITTKCNIV